MRGLFGICLALFIKCMIVSLFELPCLFPELALLVTDA